MAEAETIPERCQDCGAYGGQHHPLCSLASDEYKARYLEKIYHLFPKLLGQRDELRNRVTLWQGKHAMLRHENNKLRRKLVEKD